MCTHDRQHIVSALEVAKSALVDMGNNVVQYFQEVKQVFRPVQLTNFMEGEHHGAKQIRYLVLAAEERARKS
jgi:hypothetical protein